MAEQELSAEKIAKIKKKTIAGKEVFLNVVLLHQ